MSDPDVSMQQLRLIIDEDNRQLAAMESLNQQLAVMSSVNQRYTIDGATTINIVIDFIAGPHDILITRNYVSRQSLDDIKQYIVSANSIKINSRCGELGKQDSHFLLKCLRASLATTLHIENMSQWCGSIITVDSILQNSPHITSLVVDARDYTQQQLNVVTHFVYNRRRLNCFSIKSMHHLNVRNLARVLKTTSVRSLTVEISTRASQHNIVALINNAPPLKYLCIRERDFYQSHRLDSLDPLVAKAISEHHIEHLHLYSRSWSLNDSVTMMSAVYQNKSITQLSLEYSGGMYAYTNQSHTIDTIDTICDDVPAQITAINIVSGLNTYEIFIKLLANKNITNLYVHMNASRFDINYLHILDIALSNPAILECKTGDYDIDNGIMPQIIARNRTLVPSVVHRNVVDIGFILMQAGLQVYEIIIIIDFAFEGYEQFIHMRIKANILHELSRSMQRLRDLDLRSRPTSLQSDTCSAESLLIANDEC